MHDTIRLTLLLCLIGCGREQEESPFQPLDSVASLHRVSMALRGTRPSIDDIERIENNPDALRALAEEYVASEAFVRTVGDMYAERLLMRSTNLIVPNVGPLAGTSGTTIRNALSEEPLRLIEEVVRSDMPFGEIANADWTILDETGAKIWASHTYDASAGGIQKVTFTDNRPPAGILRTGGYLVRHESNGANYHRSRANMIADTLLCASFSDRDIPITGDIDLSDDAAVAKALQENVECVGCHQIVDPLASHYWGYRGRVQPNQVTRAYDAGCDDSLPPQFSCYPIPMFYEADLNEISALRGLRGPNYWGAYTENLGDVGAAVASDPRFAQCVAKTFASYLTQTEMSDLQAAEIARLQGIFDESGQSARALAVDIVTSPGFLAAATDDEEEAPISGHQVTRPEQLERMVEDWTGFTVEYGIPQQNLGNIRAMGDDLVGFRAMSGGVDGFSVTSPTHTPTPVKLLAFAAYAEDAAGYAVSKEFAEPKDTRALLGLVDANTTDEAAIRTQLVALVKVMHGTVLQTDTPQIDSLYALWSSVGTPERAWNVTLAAMIQSPDTMFY